MSRVRNLVLVLGDQLDLQSAAFDGFDRRCDLIWMAELAQESDHVWSHKARSTLFLTAMRHFAAGLKEREMPLRYLQLGHHRHRGFDQALRAEIESNRPERLLVVEPGDHWVMLLLRGAAAQAGVELEVRSDRHFLIDLEEFDQWAKGRKSPRLEYFYRFMRQRSGVLMDGNKPVGGA